MILLTNEAKSKTDKSFFISTVQRVLDLMEKSSANVNVVLVSPEKSQELNGKYRGKDKPTNILSFPNHEVADFVKPEESEELLGQIFICMDVVEREAEENSYPRDDWLTRLIVHGILHLSGYHHNDESHASQMEQREDAIYNSLMSR